MAILDPVRAGAAGLITAENGAWTEVGTPLATNRYTLSCSLVPACRGSWGGARNRADRLSDRLTLEQCEKLIAAAMFAERIGLAFNRHWTIHSERAGIDPKHGQRFIGKLLRLAGNAAKRRGHAFAAVYSRENGDGKGEHVHILMHFPADLSLRNKTRSWIGRAGGTYRRRVSKVTSIGGPLKRLDATSEHYQTNADNVLRYLLKGTDYEAASALGLTSWGEFGRIMGKRCGGTQNIWQSAQAGRTSR